MLQNIAQPQRNPASGEKVSRMNTYTPPVAGKADASSAQTNAPNSVSTPHATQTTMISVGVARCLAISEGWTKIDAPMMVPATMAVALRRVSDRGSSDRQRGGYQNRSWPRALQR